MAPHSDQRSAAIANGTFYMGNDGGIYARPLFGTNNANGNGTDWKSLNANLRTLQAYGVGVGRVTGGVAVAGGLQDNGTSLLLPEDGTDQMGSPAGGDGGKIIVDPDNGGNILAEYPALDLWKITDCRRSGGSFSAVFGVALPDSGARFIAPIVADGADKTTGWLAGSSCGLTPMASPSPAACNGCAPSTRARVMPPRRSPASVTSSGRHGAVRATTSGSRTGSPRMWAARGVS